MASGTISISIEIELGWGQHDTRIYSPLSPNREDETDALTRILDLADENHVPITFDVVGHLFLESCDGVHDGPHESDWFDEDPGTTVEDSPYFYAPDLIEAILTTETEHEIATHTFSHVLCDGIDDAVLDWELTRSIRVHESAGLSTPISMVPPRHSQPNYDVLTEHGIEIVRVPESSVSSSGIGEYLDRLWRWVSDPGHTPYREEKQDGILETYSTPYPSLTTVLLKNGEEKPPLPFRFIPKRLRQRVHRRYLSAGIDAAVETGDTSHYWTHLQNAANDQQLALIASFLDEIGERQRNGEITVKTMRDLAEIKHE